MASPKTASITPETVIRLRTIQEDSRLRPIYMESKTLQDKRKHLGGAERQRRALLTTQHEEEVRRLRDRGIVVDESQPWTPALVQDVDLLAIQAEIQAVQKELFANEDRFEEIAPAIRDEIVVAMKTLLVQHMDMIIQVMQEDRATAVEAEALCMRV